MLKNELIKLKEKIAQKVLMIDIINDHVYSTSLYELENKKNNSEKIVEYFKKYFEKIIIYYNKKEKNYNEIQLTLTYGLFFKEEDIIEIAHPIKYKKNTLPINDLIRFEVGGFNCINKNGKFNNNPEEVFQNDWYCGYIVSLKELKTVLEEQGFELTEDFSMESIAKKFMDNKIPSFTISLNFSKTKKLSKK